MSQPETLALLKPLLTLPIELSRGLSVEPAQSAQPRAPKANAVRRSQRILLAVHVVVGGYLPTGAPFAEESITQIVNAHGGLILMKQMVTVGDHLRLRNVKTGEEIGCNVVDIGERIDHKCGVGVEFDEPSPRFWRVSFPPDDWSPRSAEAKRFTVRQHPAQK